MLEKNKFSSEKIVDSTEKISDSTEKISSDTEKIPQIPEKMTEKITEKRRKGQRGQDKKPRKINQNSLRNLKPFQNLSEKCILVYQDGRISEGKKSIWKKPEFWLGAGATITAFAFLAWKLYEIMDKSRQEDFEESEDEIKQLEE